MNNLFSQHFFPFSFSLGERAREHFRLRASPHSMLPRARESGSEKPPTFSSSSSIARVHPETRGDESGGASSSASSASAAAVAAVAPPPLSLSSFRTVMPELPSAPFPSKDGGRPSAQTTTAPPPSPPPAGTQRRVRKKKRNVKKGASLSWQSVFNSSSPIG